MILISRLQSVIGPSVILTEVPIMAGLVEGKVALVTGAGSGIGRATAMTFAREGARVVVSDISVPGGEETVEMIRKSGGQASFIAADVSKQSDVKSLIERTVAAYGRLDCAFNNAGFALPVCELCDGTEEDFDRTMAVNLKGIWLCLKYEIPQMLRQGGGSIVNTASNAGMIAFPGMAIYAASKGGVVQLTRTAAVEYARKGIRVNAVCPAITQTPAVQELVDALPDVAARITDQVPLGRMGKPSEIAEAVVWLCSDRASFVTAAPIPVDGGSINV
jgi:NAD(P)-dependent dehydrogenase (short-subunit alcohol dehydrogenase family)